MEEEKIERTTVELFKKPDLEILRNLKASLTLKFNTEVSYRDAILYLFASRVLGTKSANAFISEVADISGISGVLNRLIDFFKSDPHVRADKLSELHGEILKINNDFISYQEAWSDEHPIATKKEIARIKRGQKEFLEALKKIENAEIDALWKVK